MKLNLNVAITFGGQINVVKSEALTKMNSESVTTAHRSFNKTTTIDLSNLTCDIVVNEEVEDITPKEYIQAIGEAVKTALGGMMSKVNTTKCE